MGACFWKGKGEKNQTNNAKCFTFRKLVKANAEKKPRRVKNQHFAQTLLPMRSITVPEIHAKPEKRGESLKHTGDTGATAQDTTLLDSNESRGGDGVKPLLTIR